MKYILLIFSILILMAGCSRRPQPQTYHTPEKRYKPSAINTNPEHKTSTSEQTSSRLQKLYTQYKNWKGTPYQYGGLSQDGVDCSGFVHQTYRSLFNISLARSTKDQVTQGRRVYMNELSAGDLVFFKTGLNVRHVGIYLEKGKFAHASTSKGVMISSMYTGYWKENYWQARRLL